MSLETVFFTQLGSVVVFLLSLFAVYRILVSSKDATIETLRQQVDFLEDKVKASAEIAPDILLQRHAQRATLLTRELEAAEREKEPLITEIEKLKRMIAAPETEDQSQVLVNQVVAARVTLENQLHEALDNCEFVLHYQPKVNMSGKLTSVEALLRCEPLGFLGPNRKLIFGG